MMSLSFGCGILGSAMYPSGGEVALEPSGKVLARYPGQKTRVGKRHHFPGTHAEHAPYHSNQGESCIAAFSRSVWYFLPWCLCQCCCSPNGYDCAPANKIWLG